MRETIARVLREMSVAAQAIQEGRLDVRANPEDFAGDWRKLIVDMNSMIDQFAEPHRLMTDALDRLAKGDIPNRVTHDARGEFSASQGLSVADSASPSSIVGYRLVAFYP